MGDSSSPTKSLSFCCDRSVARIRGLQNLLCLDLGLTPQALCFRLLRRLRSHFLCKAHMDWIPRVKLDARHRSYPVLLSSARVEISALSILQTFTIHRRHLGQPERIRLRGYCEALQYHAA